MQEHAEPGDQQQEQPEPACDVPQQDSQQQCQQQQDQGDSKQPYQHSISPVAQELVGVLAVALQQQVATCSSLQVSACTLVPPQLWLWQHSWRPART